jgi:hypothetical protein
MQFGHCSYNTQGWRVEELISIEQIRLLLPFSFSELSILQLVAFQMSKTLPLPPIKR